MERLAIDGNGTISPPCPSRIQRWKLFGASVVLPDGNDVESTYGLWSQTTTDPHGHTSTTSHDAYGRTVLEEAEGVETRSEYDLLGRLVGLEDDVGNTWSWSFDSLGRNTEKDDPDAGVWSYEYDDAGRVTAQIDTKGQRIEYDYDPAGRPTAKTVLGSPPEVTTTAYGEARTGYYNAGRMTTVTSPASVLKLDYDAAGRVVKGTRTLDAVDYVMEHHYDAAGFLLGTTYPDGDAFATLANPFVYDAAGRLLAVPGVISQISYDASGRPTQLTNLNGTTTQRSYSADRGFLEGIVTTGPTGTIQDVAYGRDVHGLITSVTSPFPNESWSYQYDAHHRLVNAANVSSPVESQSFQYDTIGRITYNSRVGTYVYPAAGSPRPHAPLAVAGTSYSYDGNGNATAGGGLALTWDAENRLTQFSAGSTTATFVYDASGGRLGKTDGTNVSVYPFGDDYEITNGEVTKYLAVDRVGVVAKRVGSSGAIQNYWLHTDSLGSIQTTSDAGGAEVQRRTFGPYGETTSESGSESRGWIDQRLDPETGLTYLHARYYASHFGMFISPDPMHPASPGVGMNRYAYGLGDPINRTDRSGLAPCELVAGEVRCWDWSRAGGVPGGGGPGGSGGGGGGSTGSGSTGGGVGGGRSGGPAGGGGGGAQREGFCRTYPAFCQEEQEEQETPQPDNPTTPDRRQADGEMHETADDAASSVLIEHNPQSIETNTEYCFGICERDGSYFATPAQWSFEKPTESCDLWTYCPGGGTLVGHAHTHARYGNDGFSGVDVAGWRTPGFGLRWVSTPALNIWKFDPTREGSKIILLCDDCFE